MKTTIALLAAVSTLVAAPFARAQATGPAVEFVEPVSAASPARADNVALAKRYFTAIGFEGQLGTILTNLTSPEQLGARKDLSSEERDAIVASAAEAMDEAMPLMLDEAARITARTFTPAQLKDMIAFYETDSGQAIAAKTAVLPPMASQLVMTFAPLIRADAMVRACAKVDCETETPIKVKA